MFTKSTFKLAFAAAILAVAPAAQAETIQVLIAHGDTVEVTALDNSQFLNKTSAATYGEKSVGELSVERYESKGVVEVCAKFTPEPGAKTTILCANDSKGDFASTADDHGFNYKLHLGAKVDTKFIAQNHLDCPIGTVEVCETFDIIHDGWDIFTGEPVQFAYGTYEVCMCIPFEPEPLPVFVQRPIEWIMLDGNLILK